MSAKRKSWILGLDFSCVGITESISNEEKSLFWPLCVRFGYIRRPYTLPLFFLLEGPKFLVRERSCFGWMTSNVPGMKSPLRSVRIESGGDTTAGMSTRLRSCVDYIRTTW